MQNGPHPRTNTDNGPVMQRKDIRMLSLLDNVQEVNGVPPKPLGSPTEISRMKVWLEERVAKSKKSPLVEIVTLTPVLAQLLLERNPINRPISKLGRSEIRQDIANGRYVFNGESIIVSDAGTLNDGQHRCMTVLDTGIPIQTVIVFGPKEETRFTVDSGRSKSVSNFLSMKGRKYTHILGAVAGFTLQWKQFGLLGTGGGQRPTKQAILDAADRFKGIDASVELAASGLKTVGNTAVLAFAHYAIWKGSSRENADFFLKKLIDGDGLRKGDPILYCRNRLAGMGTGVNANTRAELLLKCWNAHRLGHGIDHFKLNGGKLPKVER
jgi:hypothetical protein